MGCVQQHPLWMSTFQALYSALVVVVREQPDSLCTLSCLCTPIMSLKDYKHLRDSTNADDLIAFLGSIESGSTSKHRLLKPASSLLDPPPTSPKQLSIAPLCSSTHRLTLALVGSDKSEFMNELLSDLDKVPESWNEQGREEHHQWACVCEYTYNILRWLYIFYTSYNTCYPDIKVSRP